MWSWIVTIHISDYEDVVPLRAPRSWPIYPLSIVQLSWDSSSKQFLLLYKPTTFNFCADLAMGIESGNPPVPTGTSVALHLGMKIVVLTCGIKIANILLQEYIAIHCERVHDSSFSSVKIIEGRMVACTHILSLSPPIIVELQVVH